MSEAVRTTESWALRHGGAHVVAAVRVSVSDGGAAARVEFVAATASTVRLRLRLHAVRSGRVASAFRSPSLLHPTTPRHRQPPNWAR